MKRGILIGVILLIIIAGVAAYVLINNANDNKNDISLRGQERLSDGDNSNTAANNLNSNTAANNADKEALIGLSNSLKNIAEDGKSLEEVSFEPDLE